MIDRRDSPSSKPQELKIDFQNKELNDIILKMYQNVVFLLLFILCIKKF